MQVMFFGNDGFLQPLLDRRIVQFTSSTDNPAPPLAFIQEHFRQAVLANMRGAGEIPCLDYDETDDAQSMATFESGEGKQWLETLLGDRLVPDVDDLGLKRYTRTSTMG